MLTFSEIFEFSREKPGKFLFWKNSNASNASNASNGANGSVPRRPNLSTPAPAAPAAGSRCGSPRACAASEDRPAPGRPRWPAEEAWIEKMSYWILVIHSVSEIPVNFRMIWKQIITEQYLCCFPFSENIREFSIHFHHFLHNKLQNILRIWNLIFEKIIFDIAKKLDAFCWNVEVWAVQKHVNLVDLVKSFLSSNEYLLAKFGVDTGENEPL